MSASPLLEPIGKHRGARSGLPHSAPDSHVAVSRFYDSPVLPRALAPLFTNLAADDTTFLKNKKERISSPLSAASERASSPASVGSKAATSPQIIRLVPKNVAQLAASGREALLNMIDPQPDWTLQDLKQELESLAEKLNDSPMYEAQTRIREGAVKQRWGWEEEVADFGRSSKPFVMRLDDDDEDDDEEEDGGSFETCSESDFSEPSSVHENSPTRSPAHEIAEEEILLPAMTGKIEAALIEADRLRLLRVQEELRQTRAQLECALLEETQRCAEKIARVLKDEEAKCEMTRRSDKQYQRYVAEQRDKHLSALQRDHEQRSQVEERKIRKEEEDKRRERAAREEMERQIREKAEAEAAAKAAEAERIKRLEAQRAEEERKKQAEAAEAQRREAENKEKQKEVQKRPQGEPRVRVAKAAAEDELRRKNLLKQLSEASQLLQANQVMQKNLKALGYQISKIWSQVTTTEEQVRKKSLELLQHLNNLEIQAYVVSTLAAKLMSQCEIQVLKVPSFAFAFARIVVTVSNQVPVVMDAVIAHLNSVCIFTVPKFFLYNKTDYVDNKSYYKLLGYLEKDSGKLETEDEFVARMSAYVRLYAAITQTQGPNLYGISNGWKWCAQLLNNLPANRYTASALYAYLEAAGFRLHQAYPKPFMKLLQAIVRKFVPLLQQQEDPDSRAVLNRLETYLGTQQFLKRPNDELSQHTYSADLARQFF